MFYHDIPNPEKKVTMASAKITMWFLIQILGWSATTISLSDKIINFLSLDRIMGIPAKDFQFTEPYQSVISWLAIAFLIVMICRSVVKMLDSIEIWRHKRMSNNEKAYQLKRMHDIEKQNP